MDIPAHWLKCRTCGARTLPEVAETQWRHGQCLLCRNSTERAAVKASLRRYEEHESTHARE